MNNRLIHISKTDIATSTKDALVKSINNMGFDYITTESSWDEIGNALDSVESIGYRITVRSLYPHSTIDELNLSTQFERLADIPTTQPDLPSENYVQLAMLVNASNNINITFE
jgi:hypothetical protein